MIIHNDSSVLCRDHHMDMWMMLIFIMTMSIIMTYGRCQSLWRMDDACVVIMTMLHRDIVIMTINIMIDIDFHHQ